MSFDQETGELPDLNVSERALGAARAERQARRDDAKGFGLTEIYTALLAAQRVIAPVMAQDEEGHHKGKDGKARKFTSYAGLIRIVRKPLLDRGIIIRHRTDRVFQLGEGGTTKSSWITIITDLIHAESGQVISSELPMPIVRTDPQAVGIAVSYGKRITLLSGLGLASGDPNEDDDAEGAMPRDLSERDDAAELITEIEATTTEAEANKLRATYHRRLQEMAPEAYDRAKEAFVAHVKKLRGAASSGEPPSATPAKPAPRGPKNRIAPTTPDVGRA